MADAMVRVRFEPDGLEAEVPAGTTLLDAATIAGATIDAPCGGVGRCGACRVTAEGPLSALTADESDILGGASVASGKRLACRARARGDVTVTLGRTRARTRVVTGSTVPVAGAASEPSGVADRPGTLGAAVDIGTTTLAVAIVDLASGEVRGETGALNPQTAFGADVMSRVTAALDGRAGALQTAVASAVEGLVAETLGTLGAVPDSLTRMTVCGNTAMTALLLGRDVTPLAAAPYASAPTSEAVLSAQAVGMPRLEHAEVYVLPGISAFIGSDISAGILATRLDERTVPALYIDLGTNGEIVLAGAGRMLAASTAAGPALEGASLECGMRAEPGAIERVSRGAGALEIGVIGDVAPTGICGSGVLDLVAVLLDAGVLAPDGRLIGGAGPLGERVSERGDQRVFTVDPESGVVLTQKDVRQVQLAVAAVRTGIDLLLAEAGIGPGAIAEVVVAGGFGLHVEAASLTRIGLLPAEWADRVSFVGNSALAGTRMALTGAGTADRLRALGGRVRSLDLAAHPAFQARFLAALTFPA